MIEYSLEGRCFGPEKFESIASNGRLCKPDKEDIQNVIQIALFADREVHEEVVEHHHEKHADVNTGYDFVGECKLEKAHLAADDERNDNLLAAVDPQIIGLGRLARNIEFEDDILVFDMPLVEGVVPGNGFLFGFAAFGGIQCYRFNARVGEFEKQIVLVAVVFDIKAYPESRGADAEVGRILEAGRKFSVGFYVVDRHCGRSIFQYFHLPPDRHIATLEHNFPCISVRKQAHEQQKGSNNPAVELYIHLLIS